LSGFAVLYDLSNTPVEPGVLERVMGRLSHRGPDGHDVLVEGSAALGHWHFWTTPEEIGEKQPLELEGLPFTIVLDGRLDNRKELLSGLDLDPQEGLHLSDAAMILKAYDRWGEACFERLLGEYAVVILDKLREELVCARDALGDRTMFFSTKGSRLVIASEPWAIAEAENTKVELEESAIARYFAFENFEDGQTLFKNICEISPAQVIVFSAAGKRKRYHWKPDYSVKLRDRSDKNYADEFRSILEESIRCRLRVTTQAGILMSGGLDSTSVACLAAQMLGQKTLTTISYVFDELPECDERQYIEMVRKRWNTHSIQIPCDDLWPWKDWLNWPVNPNHPEGNPYRLLKERTYQRANQEGIRVLLTGGFGDHLYSTGSEWLADLVFEGHLLEASRELGLYLRYSGLLPTMKAGFIQKVGKRVLNTLPGISRVQRKVTLPQWLTPYASGYLSKTSPFLPSAKDRYRNLLGNLAAASSTGEIFNANRHALELRHPYRDRRLVEYILKVPAYQLHHRGLFKHILRNAMREILPNGIRLRPQQTSLVTLFARGQEREQKNLAVLFREENAVWRKYVRSDWVEKQWDVPVTAETDGPQALIGWMCTSFSKWYNRAEIMHLS
jgi:asparagine synthase (glutamine-hydrolysing)